MTSTFANLRKGGSTCRTRHSQKVMQGERLCSVLFPYALEIPQLSITRKDVAADGTLRTLSRIDRAFIDVPMAVVKQISDDHPYPDEPFAALVQKARKRREFWRNTQVSEGAKLLIAATVLRANRNKHLGTLMHCCAAWDPVWQ